jgi:uncharacterized membrane protein YdbT with pleckstrin-like domain
VSRKTKAGLKATGSLLGGIAGFLSLVWIVYTLGPHSFFVCSVVIVVFILYCLWQELYEDFLR